MSAARLSAAAPQTVGAASWPAASPEPAKFDAATLLTTGGDNRIELQDASGLNRYGCAPRPDADIAPFGSSTASTISPAAFAAAERLTGRLAIDATLAPHAQIYRQELERIRARLHGALGLTDVAGLKTVISLSGTDLHRIALHITGAGAASPPLVIMPEPHETGSGVIAALGGQVGPGPALRAVASSVSLESALAAPQIMTAPSRAADGCLRPAHEVDEDISVIVSAAARQGRRVLLVLMDVSKTGLTSPSIACAQDLKQRFPEQVEVFVDACQLRLAPATLAAYLAQDFMIGITGSKFMTGPAFSAALLIPPGVSDRLSQAPLPRALTRLCALGEWPEEMTGERAFDERANFGLLLRWEAALEEMRAFSQLPQTAVQAFFTDFAEAMGERLAEDASFEAITVRPIERMGLGVAPSWDRIQTIFPFALRAGGRLMTPVETMGVHRLLGADLGDWAGWSSGARRIQLGQPVNCGARGSEPLIALRICMSARLACAALSTGGRGAAAVIGEAIDVLDKTAWLATRLADA